MDIIVVVIILMNFGALFITNVLVVRENEQLVDLGVIESWEIVEANPVQAEINDYKTTDEAQSHFKSWLIFLVYWSIMTFVYILIRKTFYTEFGFYFMMFFVLFYLLVLGSDFFNNLGYYIGKLAFSPYRTP